MSLNDPISDLLARIKNGQAANLAFVTAPASKKLENLLAVLKREGYIRDFEREGSGTKAVLRVDLKYHDGEPVIKELKRVSKPGRRTYSAIGKLPKVHNGLGIYILSTPKGLLSDYEARIQNVGGEVVCSVF